MRKQIAAANWKMNLNLPQAIELLDAMANKNMSLAEHQLAVVGVPFPYLITAVEKLKSAKSFFVAAQ
ncbi:MAG: triose-phosphate isomerase, partial [Ginsengibacter sp.]